MNKFKLSISTECFQSKEEIDNKKLNFVKDLISITEFKEKIAEGYCFAHWFDTPKDKFHISEKGNDNFDRANCVFVDVDNYDMEMLEFVAKLRHKPTICYTTYSNGLEGYGCRFRICFLFNEDIRSKHEFETVYAAIIQDIRNYVPDYPDKDKCGSRVSQYMSGNGSPNCAIQATEISYSLKDFNVVRTERSVVNKKLEKEQRSRAPIIKKVPFTDMEFRADFYSLSPLELIAKYRDKYPYFEQSHIEFNEHGYAVLDEDYIEINRYWCIDTIQKENGDERKIHVRKKFRDKERRRYHLFLSALLRKKIKPDITFEHLLYNLVCERLWHYDNSDKVLSNEFLVEKAENVMNTPVEDINLKSKRKRPKYRVDKGYCQRNGIKPLSKSNQVRGELNTARIMERYDLDLSVKENLESLRLQGIKVGKSKLYDLCKQLGIPTNPKRNRRNIKGLT